MSAQSLNCRVGEVDAPGCLVTLVDCCICCGEVNVASSRSGHSSGLGGVGSGSVSIWCPRGTWFLLITILLSLDQNWRTVDKWWFQYVTLFICLCRGEDLKLTVSVQVAAILFRFTHKIPDNLFKSRDAFLNEKLRHRGTASISFHPCRGEDLNFHEVTQTQI